MKKLRAGDRVAWSSEAGRVTGIIRKKISAPMRFKGYTVHASRDEPQYLIVSEKTDHLAMHKGAALRKLTRRKRAASSKHRRRRRAS